jgi:hypothetical protein
LTARARGRSEALLFQTYSRAIGQLIGNPLPQALTQINRVY